MANKYSWKKTLWKGVRNFLIFAIPVVIMPYLTEYNPEILGMTVGGLLTMAVNWLKTHKL